MYLPYTAAIIALLFAAAVRADAPPDIAPIAEGATLNCRFDLADDPTAATYLAIARDESPSFDEEVPPGKPADATPPFGQRDSARLDLHVGFGFEVHESENTLILAGVGYSYFMRDDFAIVIEFNGLYIDQFGPDAVGINLNLMLRYHFISLDTWSVYLDGGAGLLFTDNDVPVGVSEFNLTPQLGIGFTCDVGSDNRLMAGLRWYHISNANTDPINPGRDHVYFYAGLSLPF